MGLNGRRQAASIGIEVDLSARFAKLCTQGNEDDKYGGSMRCALQNGSTQGANKMRVTIAMCTAVVSLALASEAVPAERDYPDHTVKIIVPTSPGAVTDVLARALAQALSQTWGRSVIVENRPGGDEMIGDEMVAKATPDGYTLGVVSNSGITSAPLLHRDVRYDPVKDFTPVDMLGQITPVMVVPTKSPVHTVQELIALARSEPGQLNFGSFGTGPHAQVAMEEFMQRTGIKMTHVPYRGVGEL